MVSPERPGGAEPTTTWMLIPTFYPVIGGAQTQTLRLATLLRQRGWPARVLTRQHSYAHPQGLPADAVIEGLAVRRTYSRGPGKLGAMLSVITGVAYLARFGRRGIFHAHDIGAAGWTAVAARYLLGGRCLVKLRTGCSVYRRHYGSGLSRRGFKALLMLTDRVVVVSREVQSLVIDELQIPPERVVFLPNGVDTTHYCPPADAARRSCRERLGYSADQTVCLYVGRLEHLKGVDILLRGWAAAFRRRPAPSARLVVVGDGPERAALERLRTELGLGESVSFRGESHQIRDHYWASDLFVLPSRTEGLSNALVEAMSCGLPVIASRAGGSVDIVDDGENGYLFDEGNVDALAGRLTSMLSNRRDWAALGRKARIRATAHADIEALADRVSAVYQALTRQTPASAPVSISTP